MPDLPAQNQPLLLQWAPGAAPVRVAVRLLLQQGVAHCSCTGNGLVLRLQHLHIVLA